MDVQKPECDICDKASGCAIFFWDDKTVIQLTVHFFRKGVWTIIAKQGKTSNMWHVSQIYEEKVLFQD